MLGIIWKSGAMTLLVISISQIVSFSIHYSAGQPFTFFVFVMNSILPVLTAFPTSFYIFSQNAKLRRALNELKALHAELSRRAAIDGMTGVLNRDTFMEHLWEIRKKAPEGVLLLVDADHFKGINDRYGHAAGDLALATISQQLRAEIVPDSLLGRIGGEAFAVYLPRTSMESGVEIAEHYRKRIEQVDFRPIGRDRHQLTVSIGAAPVRPEIKLTDILREADQNLYEAKSKGRNRVVSPLDNKSTNRRPNLVVIPGRGRKLLDV
ncbi:GGDEF domain-containing protein [Microvirga lotononidis]|uniref:diguanylate cyclase n=1 Tax=Microvirga lotononidis TaxID=864069 RepID=I4Z143_9HYPH|nr:GGDEF domain-containing protein [Microvirga lotononidis]EIM29935.1 diguanylate cyclase (GGDEF) domain-containing protein [Microvirga lotononidis]WQO32003.1 GGDEF domain-containing protein [Microvirga lotononidis]